MPEIIKWDRFEYEPKTFCLATLYDYYERVGEAGKTGKVLTGSFDAACQALLKGTTKEAQAYLTNGSLTSSVLNCEDAEKAMAFKKQVDFWRDYFSERADALEKSAPDLTAQLQAKKQRSQSRKSPKDSNTDTAHSG
jgi:hypothetical protein